MTYTTKQGDMWDSIARSQLGSEKYMDKLISANRQLSHVLVFSAGVVLTIPDVDTSTAKANLPPWKKVAG